MDLPIFSLVFLSFQGTIPKIKRVRTQIKVTVSYTDCWQCSDTD